MWDNKLLTPILTAVNHLTQ